MSPMIPRLVKGNINKTCCSSPQSPDPNSLKFILSLPQNHLELFNITMTYETLLFFCFLMANCSVHSSKAKSAQPESARPVSSRTGCSTAVPPSSRPLSALGPPSSRALAEPKLGGAGQKRLFEQLGLHFWGSVPY